MKLKKMAPKKDTKKEEKKKAPEAPELKELREKEKALTKVPAPDKTDYDVANTKITEDIGVLQTKLQAIGQEIGSKNVGKDEHNAAKMEIRAKLDEYSSKIDELEKRRKAIQGSIDDVRKSARDKRSELNDMKKKLGYETEEDINNKIADVERAMMTGSFDLKTEKKMMVEISELKKSRPLVAKYKQMEDTAGGGGDVGSMRDSIGDIMKQLNELRDAKKLQAQALSKLQEARQKVMGDVPKLFQKKEAINSEIREKIKERNGLRDAFNIKNREYMGYLNEVRALRGERARIERKQRNDEWETLKKAERAEDGPAALPFADDLQTLANVVAYLKGLQPAKEVAKKTEEATKDFAAPKGNMVLLDKSSREEEFFFAPTKRKGLKKGSAKKSKPIVHSLETLGFFDKYKVSPPTTLESVDATLAEVEKKAVEYKEKQTKAVEKEKEKAAKKAKGEGEEGEKGEEAAAAEAAAESPEGA